VKSYLDLLNKLIAFGPKLIALWPLIQKLLAVIQEIADAVKAVAPATDGGLNLEAPTVAEQEAEERLGEALAADGTLPIIDFGTLRGLWTLLKAHPELVLALNAILDWTLAKFGKGG
jgi:hypothetical protein